MEKTETKQNVTAKRLVLFADIMGFKDRVLRTEHMQLKADLLAFKTKWLNRMKPLEKGDHLYYSQYSDSIVIATDGVGEQQANLITKAGIILMQECLREGFPLKGAVAEGEFTYDETNQLFFGQPLVDAYLLQEVVKYYGIVLHHTAEKTIMDCPEAKKHYSKSRVFLENERIAHDQLCWQKVDLTLNERKECIWRPWLDKIARQVSGRSRIYVDNTRMILEEQERKTW